MTAISRQLAVCSSCTGCCDYWTGVGWCPTAAAAAVGVRDVMTAILDSSACVTVLALLQ